MLRKLVLIVGVAGCADVELGSTEQNAIGTNAIGTNAIGTNAIGTNAIASTVIATNPLAPNGTVTDATIALALEDPNARIFMKYLVGCALTDQQYVRWTNHDGSLQEIWRGNFGLCPAWQTSAPGGLCRQRVSSCILARNNAFGVSVMFSMRGASGAGALPLAASVPAHDHVPRTATPVASLAQCGSRMYGEQRDCGWSISSVGRCNPGEHVSIAEGNYAGCGSQLLGQPANTDTMLRICDGTSACDYGTAIASVNDACGSTRPGVELYCPASGLFAAMVAPYDTGTRRVTFGAVGATVPYPSPEIDVFPWREGAFFGDIFGSWNLDPAKPQVWVDPRTFQVMGAAASSEFTGVAFPNAYACSSQNWVDSMAYFARRVCAGPDPAKPWLYTRDCAATYVGPCKNVCQTSDWGPSGDQDYGDCSVNDAMWRFPMTPMLSDPCDAVPGAFCATVPGAPLSW